MDVIGSLHFLLGGLFWAKHVELGSVISALDWCSDKRGTDNLLQSKYQMINHICKLKYNNASHPINRGIAYHNEILIQMAASTDAQ